jgi:DNA-binding Lrp family transcriptional regulator
MTLTHRQTTIVRTLLDLYGEAHEPIPYRAVAERLGVSGPTAYRMLRLAEARGYAAAVYAPRPPVGGVGRSAVLFAPTALAQRRIVDAAGPSADLDWEATKRRVLEALQGRRLPDAGQIRELVADLDQPTTPLGTAGRLIAALMITLEESRLRNGRGELPIRLADTGGRMGLAALGGILVGLAWADRTRRALSARLEQQLQRLTEALATLSPAEEADLMEFVEQLSRRLRARRDALRGREGPAAAAVPGGRARPTHPAEG